MGRKTKLALVAKKPTPTGDAGAPNGHTYRKKHGFYLKNVSQLDKRTSAYQFWREFCDQLTTDAGSDPSGARGALIKVAALKYLRLRMAEQAFLDSAGQPGGLSMEHFLALSNSLRHDLIEIGLERRPKRVQDLDTYQDTYVEQTAAEGTE